MTQTHCQCGCEHPQLTMVPVQGFGLAMDLSGLKPDPTPMPLCRERVDHDMHLYIDGNLTESGDGLTPETAVKSYEDAVAVLSHYDGCNTYRAVFHFADLRDPNAAYLDIAVPRSHHSTFRNMALRGVSHETTMFGAINGNPSGSISVANLCATRITVTAGWLEVHEKVAVRPAATRKDAFNASFGGTICLYTGAEVFVRAGNYTSLFRSIQNGAIYNVGAAAIHTLGKVDVEQGFVWALATSNVRFSKLADFSDCASVTGRKYLLSELSSLYLGGLTLPGSLAGVAKSGSVAS